MKLLPTVKNTLNDIIDVGPSELFHNQAKGKEYEAYLKGVQDGAYKIANWLKPHLLSGLQPNREPTPKGKLFDDPDSGDDDDLAC